MQVKKFQLKNIYGKLINTIISLFLLALFILPCKFLTELSDYLIVSAEHAVDAALNEDWETGTNLLEEMNSHFKSNKSKLYLFLNHESIEGLDDALHSALLLMYIEDVSEAVQQLSNVIAISNYLKIIEQFSWFTLI